MLVLNYRDSRPIYGQIRDGLRRMIISGVLGPDEQLPSVRRLAMDLAINPNTIQRAYGELETEGYIYSIPGKGSFAAPGKDRCAVQACAELMERLAATAAELRFLGVSDEEMIHRIREERAQ